MENMAYSWHANSLEMQAVYSIERGAPVDLADIKITKALAGWALSKVSEGLGNVSDASEETSQTGCMDCEA